MVAFLYAILLIKWGCRVESDVGARRGIGVFLIKCKMKKVKSLVFIITLMISLSSCYSYTSIVGNGHKTGKSKTVWNHYLLGGLVPVGVSDSKVMAGESKDYTVRTRHTFVNSLVCSMTWGIYCPTTTTVKQ